MIYATSIRIIRWEVWQLSPAVPGVSDNTRLVSFLRTVNPSLNYLSLDCNYCGIKSSIKKLAGLRVLLILKVFQHRSRQSQVQSLKISAVQHASLMPIFDLVPSLKVNKKEEKQIVDLLWKFAPI